MAIVVVTGTGTEVGKTVATAAVAAASLAQGLSVAVLKPAQTGVAEGEPGDAAEVARLAGEVTAVELARYPEPLAPATAAARSGRPPVTPQDIAEAAAKLSAVHDVVLVEGAGGLLVRYDEQGSTLADAAALMHAGVLLVASPALGTLNTTALTAEAMRSRGITCLGLILGRWSGAAGLAERCNLTDLPAVAGVPLLGALPEAAAARPPAEFRARAPQWLAPQLGGVWDAAAFVRAYGLPADRAAGGAAGGPGAAPAGVPDGVPAGGADGVPGVADAAPAGGADGAPAGFAGAPAEAAAPGVPDLPQAPVEQAASAVDAPAAGDPGVSQQPPVAG